MDIFAEWGGLVGETIQLKCKVYIDFLVLRDGGINHLTVQTTNQSMSGPVPYNRHQVKQEAQTKIVLFKA